jgi:hypothetical protein
MLHGDIPSPYKWKIAKEYDSMQENKWGRNWHLSPEVDDAISCFPIRWDRWYTSFVFVRQIQWKGLRPADDMIALMNEYTIDSCTKSLNLDGKTCSNSIMQRLSFSELTSTWEADTNRRQVESVTRLNWKAHNCPNNQGELNWSSTEPIGRTRGWRTTKCPTPSRRSADSSLLKPASTGLPDKKHRL